MNAALKHAGLPKGVNRLGFIERIAPALKARSVRTSAITYLSKACNNWTRDQDYTPNCVCGHWQRVRSTAEKMSNSPRSVNSIETHLQRLGLIEITAMANGARDGVREDGEDGPLRWLRGINLAPIINLATDLIAEADAIRLQNKARDLCTSEIRTVNKRIRQMGNDLALEQSREILPNGRTAIIKEMDDLNAILSALKAVENEFASQPRSAKTSDQSEENRQPIVQNKENKNLHQTDNGEMLVTSQQAIHLASHDFQGFVEMYGDHSWRGIVQVAYEVGQSIGISDRTWCKACAAFGREKTALCVILIHRNYCLPKDHKYMVRNAGGCLSGMVRTAASRQLNLAALLAVARRQADA